MKFRKKPVVIDASKVEHNGVEPEWFLAARDRGEISRDGGTIFITTLEGVMSANLGDYVIRGVAGEIYPCKPRIFEATYDAVKETDAQMAPSHPL